jgi:hypothetical protein
MVWPHHQGYISSKNMAGTGIWRCKECLLHLVSTSKLIVVPCSVNLKVNNATKKTQRFNRVEFRTLYVDSIIIKRENLYSSSKANFYFILLFICKSVSQQMKIKYGPTHLLPFTTWIQTSKGRSFQLALCQTPAFRSAHPTTKRIFGMGGPH